MQPENNNTENIDTASLSGTLADIVELIGVGPATLLLERLGGRSLNVPKDMRDDHPLTIIIGKQAATLLIERYSLERIDLPKHDAIFRAIRDTEIRRRRAAGESPSSLAPEFLLTERHIRRIAPMQDD